MMASPKIVKDRNKPKGPMTAYACFVQVIREEHKKKHPGEQIIFSEFSKKCAERWKSMSPKEKKRFEDMAAVDKERFNNEMNSYIPPDGVKKGKKRKMARDPGQPKRAWSAFFFFCDEYRAKIKEVHPEWKVADIAKELGRRWEDCPDKPKYETLAQQDKQRYEEDMMKYRAGNYVPPKQPKSAEMFAGASAGAGDVPASSVNATQQSAATANGSGAEVENDEEVGLADVTSASNAGAVEDDDVEGECDDDSGAVEGSTED